MSSQNPTGGSGGALLQPDVLIIGGGVQGLWLLNDLQRAGYLALLLERRELGGEQTCHSHVYIHQGYLYNRVNLAARLKEVKALWESWLEDRPQPACGVIPSYFGFPSPAKAQEKAAFWSDPRLSLSYTDDGVPPALEGGAITVALRSPEWCLDGEWLVNELRRNVEDHLSRVELVRSISVNTSLLSPGRVEGGCVENVHVSLATSREPVSIRPRALVLAAGAGNQALLYSVSGGNQLLLGRISGVQQIRLAYMLVVRGSRDHLAPLTGVFPDLGGLFVVSRELKDEHEVVWLISDDRSQSLSFVEDWLVYDARWWLARVMLYLRELAPRCFGDHRACANFSWAIYSAPKAEGRAGGSIPHEERIEQFGMTNLWVVWPTKLTLAPRVSAEVLAQIRQALGPGQGGSPLPEKWLELRDSPATAPERWKKIPFDTWEKFSQQYNL